MTELFFQIEAEARGLFEKGEIVKKREQAIGQLWKYKTEIINSARLQGISLFFCCCKKSYDGYRCKRKKFSCEKSFLEWMLNIYLLDRECRKENNNLFPIEATHNILVSMIVNTIDNICKNYDIEI